ncbi:hypothetical protein MOV66_10160 [Agrobacterium sp. SHOUNA12C]|nr:hypothetical protein [Agrobacterium sp. BETTINA12B]MCJ9757006.1 hypothetical protein [Agrobacterium sp. SHOUNA12C]
MLTPKHLPKATDEAPRKVVMALIGCIPIPGTSIIQLLLDMIWRDPAYEYLKRYVEGLAADIARLEDNSVFDLEEALKRPETRILFNRAFEAAARSIGEQKLQALRTATVQGVFERQYSFDMSMMVFSLLDRVTEGHIRMLQFIHEQQSKGGGGAQLAQLTMLGVEFNGDGNGFVRPAGTLTGQYYDESVATLNSLIMDDLLNMGLIAIDDTNYSLPSDWTATKTGPRYLSTKGALFYEHIFPDTGSTVP